MNVSHDILLVEDSQNDIDLALYALREEKLANSISVVRDGKEALDFLFCRGAYAERSFDHPPKLVLLDLKLPKVDGLHVLKQLKNDPRTKTIPVVIMTSSSEERDLIESYNLGVNSYIQKPVDFGSVPHDSENPGPVLAGRQQVARYRSRPKMTG